MSELEKQIHEQLVSDGLPVMITITEREYRRLIQRDYWLQCLEEAGVDDWSGYSFAQEILREKQEA